MSQTLPLFPLGTVLFPGGDLKLRLFEPRYIDMVRECLRVGGGFGVCLISAGAEAGRPAEFFRLGTACAITDFETMPDGLLGVNVRGERRFRVERSTIRADNLCVGEVTFLAQEDARLPVSYQGFSDLLKEIATRYDLPFAAGDERFARADWVSARLSELLPFEMPVKQALLEMDNALSRFDYIQTLLERMGAGQSAPN